MVTTLAMGLASPQQLSQSFGGQTFGKQLKSVTQWNSLDFVFNSPQERQEALTAGRFIPENCIPLDMDVDYNSSEWGLGVPVRVVVMKSCFLISRCHTIACVCHGTAIYRGHSGDAGHHFDPAERYRTVDRALPERSYSGESGGPSLRRDRVGVQNHGE